MTSSSTEFEQIARSQTRQQILLVIVCILLITCIIATLKSVSATREANALQKQLLMEKVDASPSSPQKRPAAARPVNKSSAESHRSHSVRAAPDGSMARQQTVDNAVPADPPTVNAVVARTGRQ
jgi:hypothetical protein